MTTSANTNASGLPLLGKVAIVTGAARGIGAEIAYKLASDGATVYLGYTSDSSAAKVSDVLKRIQTLPHEAKAHAIKANLGQLDGPDNFVAQLRSLIGGDPKIDILVNNAGMGGKASLADITPKQYDDIFNVNVRGLLLLTVAIRPFIQPHGRIINLSSIVARFGLVDCSVYTASKAAVEGLTRSWAAELGNNGTTVNAVSPGPVPSDMLDSGMDEQMINFLKAQTPIENRIATQEEIPNIVAWLASPAASWVTGQCINASGGFQMV
ncbi:3-oxoacyl-(acyl-carrier-protein) reductase [Diaporthe helianthi]|uniref:3-oxoacyl-(Acyl-carrier-protein) reductase n=1 Tax=Diaporthe helianthi TaxID=158607 RepID=A0A2P5HEF8_DIAHE|nr:3-oxoacyl-(acyl-carrier-protein) reductase [Diaporthe helianthi]